MTMANQFQFGTKTINVGNRVAVYNRLVESGKIRTQIFDGIVIAIKNKGVGKTFTVRKIAAGGIGVERIWPLNSPWIEKIEVKSRGRARRAKLYYLRERGGKTALKVKSKIKKIEPQKPRV